jgi:hypothetical protein
MRVDDVITPTATLESSGPTTWTPTPKPAAGLAGAAARVGESMVVYGYAPGEVVITWEDGRELARVNPRPDGKFTAVFVVPDDRPGYHILTAAWEGGAIDLVLRVNPADATDTPTPAPTEIETPTATPTLTPTPAPTLDPDHIVCTIYLPLLVKGR